MHPQESFSEDRRPQIDVGWSSKTVSALKDRTEISLKFLSPTHAAIFEDEHLDRLGITIPSLTWIKR